MVCNFDVRDVDIAPIRTYLDGPDADVFGVHNVSPPHGYVLFAALKPKPEKDIYVVTVHAVYLFSLSTQIDASFSH